MSIFLRKKDECESNTIKLCHDNHNAKYDSLNRLVIKHFTRNVKDR